MGCLDIAVLHCNGLLHGTVSAPSFLRLAIGCPSLDIVAHAARAESCTAALLSFVDAVL